MGIVKGIYILLSFFVPPITPLSAIYLFKFFFFFLLWAYNNNILIKRVYNNNLQYNKGQFLYSFPREESCVFNIKVKLIKVTKS